MRNEVTLINLGKKMPLTISAVELDNSLSHMHSVTQLVIVIKGNVLLRLDNKEYSGKENDLFIINPHVLHKVESKQGAIVLSVNFDVRDFIDEDFKENIIFNLNSIERPGNPKYDTIRHMIFSLIRINTVDSVNPLFNSKAIAYSLFAQLLNEHKTNISDSKKSEKDFDTITLITSYVNDHYNEFLTLQSIAKQFNYTESYLSKLFKTSMNTTFISYYDNIRVNYSLYDLAFRKSSIEEISYKHGFESARSYVRAFKNILNMYPSDYRQEYRLNNTNPTKDADMLQKEAIDIVMNKYNEYRNQNKMNETIRDTREIITIEGLKNYEIVENPNYHIIKLGNINFLYNSSIIKELFSIQEEIRYKYLELTDTFTQTSRMYRENPDGTILLNKPMIDNILGIIYDLKLSPFFSFTASTYTTNDNLILSFMNYILLNNNYQFPKIMISLTFNQNVEHTIEEKYTYFYKIILFYQKLNEKHPNKLIFVSPELTNEEDFKIYLYSNSIYGNITNYFKINYGAWKKDISVSKNKNAIEDFLNSLNSIHPIDLKKVLLENVTFTNSTTNLLNDTLFKASYQCKNMIEIYGNIKSVVMNNMFDITIENFFDNNPYLGYSGYYTFNYTKKASYYANYFLSKLRNKVLKKGKNYIITIEDNKVVLLVNNYTHYSTLFAENQYYKLKDTERYSCFSKSTNIHFTFNFEKLNYQNAKVKITYLNKHSGSSYDIYSSIAGENVLSTNELNQLKSMCVPKFKINFEKIKDNMLSVTTSVEPLEAQLIEITFK